MRAFPLVIGVSALAFPTIGSAEPATQDGADALMHAYEAYLGAEIFDKGVLRIAPQGDSYIVTWDFQKAMDLAPSEATHVTIAPFVYTYTPAANGAWTLSADKFPAIAFSGPDNSAGGAGTVAFDGFRLEMSYDELRADFLTSTVEVSRASAKICGRNGDHDEIVDISAIGGGAEARARNGASGAGVDIDYKDGLKSFAEVVSTAPPGGEPSPDAFTFTEDSIATEGSIKGLRAREIGVLWRDAVASPDDETRTKTALADVKAALPFWETFISRVEVGAFSLRGPQVQATAKALAETVDLDGVKSASGAKFALKIDDLAVTSALAPPWAKQFSPMSVDFQLTGAIDGLDQAAETAIEDTLQNNGGDLSPDAQAKIDAILAGGHPVATIPPGRLVFPFIDIAFEGRAELSPDSRQAHFVISVDSLDKTFEVVKAIAESEPQAGVAVAGLALVKGLAKTGENGRLTWAIDVTADGKTTVNGRAVADPRLTRRLG